jgi:primosomal protein N' (replication factor Y)
MYKGMGTEKMHHMLEQLFIGHSIVRIDGSLDGEKNIREKLGQFMEGEGDILLGTQIISKGLDSENITLSVALNADLGLSLPDFRSAERDFQMLTQLAGRTGRGDKKGSSIFQTNDVNHYAIRHAIQQDYKSFYKEELSYRQSLHYPPYTRLTRFIFSFGKEKELIDRVQALMPEVRTWAKQTEVMLLGPAPAPLEKVKTRFRWHLVVKATTSGKMTGFLKSAKKHFDSLKGIEVTLDRDPQNMM